MYFVPAVQTKNGVTASKYYWYYNGHNISEYAEDDCINTSLDYSGKNNESSSVFTLITKFSFHINVVIPYERNYTYSDFVTILPDKQTVASYTEDNNLYKQGGNSNTAIYILQY